MTLQPFLRVLELERPAQRVRCFGQTSRRLLDLGDAIQGGRRLDPPSGDRKRLCLSEQRPLVSGTQSYGLCVLGQRLLQMTQPHEDPT